MSTSRRDFLQGSLAASLALAAATPLAALARDNDNSARKKAKPGAAPDATAGPLRILILGGTGFLGPACIESALARGHKVTLFNRGAREIRNKDRGLPSAVPEGVEVLYGNRDPNKTADDWKTDPKEKADNSPKGLSQLKGKSWDAVIDTSGYWPRIVKASAELLAPNIKQYVFISTLSVYKGNITPNDESSATGVLADPTAEVFGDSFENYGPGKAACEAAAEAAMPGRVTNLRPGYIVGPRDGSKRFMYWPVRAARGGDMIVPGKESDPIQVVDVRDLADFTIRSIEQNIFGVYNVTGGSQPYTMREFVDACDKGVGADTKPVWVDPEFLKTNGVAMEGPATQFPLWSPPEGEDAAFHQCVIAKAVAAGLTFRPLDDTAKVSYEWYQTLPEDLKPKMIPELLPVERESELIAKATAPK